MSNLVGNLEDRFSHDEVHYKFMCYPFCDIFFFKKRLTSVGVQASKVGFLRNKFHKTSSLSVMVCLIVG